YTPANEPGRLALSRAMMSYFAEFARSGTPGGGHGADLPKWEPWGAGRYMILDTPGGGGVRMVSGVETTDHVLADIAPDPRLPTKKSRCAVYHDLAEFGRLGITRASYPQAGHDGCAPFPYDAYPWS